MFINKRKTSRFNCKFSQNEYLFFYHPLKRNHWIQCDIYNISVDGICLRIPQILGINDIVHINIKTKNELMIFKGLVKHKAGLATGMQLVELNEIQQYFLNNLIFRLSAEAINNIKSSNLVQPYYRKAL